VSQIKKILRTWFCDVRCPVIKSSDIRLLSSFADRTEDIRKFGEKSSVFDRGEVDLFFNSIYEGCARARWGRRSDCIGGLR